MPVFDNYNYYGAATTTWPLWNTSGQYVFTEPVFQWVSLLERDRFHLIRARPFHATPYDTPTIKLRSVYILTRRAGRSGWCQRWERSPLHKRALAKR